MSAALQICVGFFALKNDPLWQCVILFGLAALTSWRVWSLSLRNHLHHVSMSLACLLCIECFLFFHQNHASVFYLIYPAVMLNFFLCSKTYAIIINFPLVAMYCILVERVCIGQTLYIAISALIFSATLSYGVAHYAELTLLRLRCTELNQTTRLKPNQQILVKTLSEQLKKVDLASQLNGLVLIHFDGIQYVQQQHGRDTNECFIRDIIDCIKALLQGAQQLLRLSTEEFVVLVHANNQHELTQISQCLRRHLSQMVPAPGKPYRVFVGSALFANATTWQDWFSRADASLFLAEKQFEFQRFRMQLTMPQDQSTQT